MPQDCQTIYLFFAPPRVGNHFVELLVAGLYPIVPIFIFHKDGRLRGDLFERYGTTNVQEILKSRDRPFVPEVSRSNPTLFIEHEQAIEDEVISRGNEVNLEQIRRLVTLKEASREVQPLVVQWFHDHYHARPYRPDDIPGIDIRYIFVVRSPQATAFSHFRIIQDRWQCYARKSERPQKRFGHFYTRDLLEEYFAYLKETEAYSETEEAFVFRYESLVSGFESLERFCSDFVGRQPKLSPANVYGMASMARLRKSGINATFYREGQVTGWLKYVKHRTLRHMIDVESEFDFASVGYPTTKQILKNWPTLLGGRLIHALTQKQTEI